MANMMQMAQLAQLLQSPQGRRMVAQNAAARGVTAGQIAAAAAPQPTGLGATIANPPIPQPRPQQAAVRPEDILPTPPIPRRRPEDLGQQSAGIDDAVQALTQAASAVRPPQAPQRPVLQPTLPRRGDVNISQAGVTDLATLMNLAQQTPQIPTLGALIGGV